MKNIRICGVPEHFNFPWQYSIENREFENQNLNLEWTDVPQGTGKMCQMLRENETDIAIILTEGIIKDIAQGSDAKIVQLFVESPLVWGIHVDFNSDLKTINDLENKKIAISRLGSGSHLMAYVHAKSMNWNTDILDFQTVHTIDGAVKVLSEKRADYFMWEKLMTKPLVDHKVFRRLAEFPTPWPSFAIAVTSVFLENSKNDLEIILQIINNQTRHFKETKNIENLIANRFKLNVNDVSIWLQETRWSQNQISEDVLNKVQNQLLDLKLIHKKVTFAYATTNI